MGTDGHPDVVKISWGESILDGETSDLIVAFPGLHIWSGKNVLHHEIAQFKTRDPRLFWSQKSQINTAARCGNTYHHDTSP
jgi:hypothetical protein